MRFRIICTRFLGAALGVVGGLACGSETASAAAGQNTCAAAVASIINDNARVSAQFYDRRYWRDLPLYRGFLGGEGAAAIDQLGPGSVFIDSGGGLGLAGLQAADKKGVRAFVINAQDFWPSWLDREDRLRGLAPIVDVDLTGIPRWEDSRLLDEHGKPLWGFGTRIGDRILLPEHAAIVRSRIEQKLARLKAEGKFNYLVGFSEEKLPTIGEKAELLTDLYGAYVYSADRTGILNQYYAALKPGGKAFIRVRTKSLERVALSDIRVPGESVPLYLEEYLVKKFPNVFHLIEDQQVLVVTRDPAQPAIDLNAYLKYAEHEMVDMDGMRVPRVQLELLKPGR